MSVWETIEDLKNFAFETPHTMVMKDQDKWFEKPQEAALSS